VLEFISQFAPHLDRRDVVRALASDPPRTDWPAVPHWRERQASSLLDVV